VQIVALGLAGFGLGRWCIPSERQEPAIPQARAEVADSPAVASVVLVVDAAATPAVGIDRSKSAHDRLCLANRSRDKLGTALHLSELIDDMTAEDFRQLAAGMSFPTPSSDEDLGFKNAFNDALVRRWLELTRKVRLRRSLASRNGRRTTTVPAWG
jgi:hypothetical protein